MAFLRFLAAAAAIALASAIEIEEENGVLVLTEDNFEEAIKQHDPLLVAFVAPWCGHCKKLKPEFEKAAKDLKADNLFVAKVDATQYKELSDRFEVSGFPTLKFFRGGAPTEYGGSREADGIAAWIRKKSGPAAVTIKTVAEAEDFESKSDVSVLCFAQPGSAAEKTCLDVAGRFDDISFGLVSEEAKDVRTKYGIGADETIAIAVNDFDGEDNLVKMTEPKIADASAADFQKWVSAHSLPLVVLFSQDNAPRIFRGELKTHFLLFADADDEGTGAAALAQFRDTAKVSKGKALFVNVPPSEERVMGYFGITEKDVPTAILVNMGDSGMKKFKYTADLVSSSFSAFVNDYAAGKLKPFLKSDATPDAAEEAVAPVKTLVGTNFEQIALDKSKDVLVEIYAPWCGHCKSLAPIYEKLGKAVQTANLSDKLVISKMDGTGNEVDVEGVSVRGFPTIYFFPAGDAKAAVEYDGSRDLDGFIAFLQKHSTNDVSALADVEDEEGEEDSE